MSGTMVTILCCTCGIEIQQNPANMCINCIRESIDITEGINRQLTIHRCRGCGRFNCPPWQNIDLESKELMATCLRKVAGLSKVKLIDAVWIWTEPHSMHLQIKITVQKEITNGAVLQQAAVLDYTIRNQQCNICQASYAQGAWQAVVQVRQRVSHKRTFFYLEQLLLKYGAHSESINIITFKDGMDFYFVEKQQSLRFIDFLEGHVPTKSKYARKLLSADHKSNVGKFRHNFIVEIAPICKDDLILLSHDLARTLSDISRLVLVKSISAGIHIVDPRSGERQEVSVDQYWRHEFSSCMSSRDLERFVVLSVELQQPLVPRPSARHRGRVSASRKTRLAEVVVAREQDLGETDTQFTCLSHLGYILTAGDTVLGYDLSRAAWSTERETLDSLTGPLKTSGLPDVVLVRKLYPKKGERHWKLRELDVDESAPLSSKDAAAAEQDYEMFLQELEGDREMRSNVNLFRARAAAKAKIHTPATRRAAEEDEGAEADTEADRGVDEEEIQLNELLDELTLASGDEISEPLVLRSSSASSVIDNTQIHLLSDEGSNNSSSNT